MKTAPLKPPQYAVEMFGGAKGRTTGLVVVRDGQVRRVPKSHNGVWLNDGRYLVAHSVELPDCPLPGRFSSSSICNKTVPAVLDPASGDLTPVPGLDALDYADMPGEALYRVTLAAILPKSAGAKPYATVMFGPKLTSYKRIKFPGYDGDMRYVSRDVNRRVFSIGAYDIVRYSDNDEEDYGRCGYLHRSTKSSQWKPTMVDQRVEALWVSSDGRALLGLQAASGRPCSGGAHRERIVEINPETGKIARSYGTPKGYDRSWRVGLIDKVDDRVLVRYHQGYRNLGVWQYDGDWSVVPGTDAPSRYTWWQGPKDRLELRKPKRLEGRDGGSFHWEIWWVHDGVEKQMPGGVRSESGESWRIPGSLVPLE